LASQAMNSPEIRQDKVDSLRQSVSSGSYQVDATKIAGALVESNGE
jgi:flagellar biosynthesis anti-sigma factor FlgM